jgi:hypothetical protein
MFSRNLSKALEDGLDARVEALVASLVKVDAAQA